MLKLKRGKCVRNLTKRSCCHSILLFLAAKNSNNLSFKALLSEDKIASYAMLCVILIRFWHEISNWPIFKFSCSLHTLQMSFEGWAITVKKIKLIQIGYLKFRTNLRFFRVIILVFRTISHYLNCKTEFGPGLEQFQQIRTILRFLDPI